MRSVDLFAGPGGFDLGLEGEPVGLELDGPTIWTRLHAGRETVCCDVARQDPADYPADLILAGPPCPPFSQAGSRNGFADLPLIEIAIGRILRGEATDDLTAKCADARSLLITEPLRFTVALKPRWLVIENVPTTLGILDDLADALHTIGYATWTGILEAERYGVPQTRERAFLLADRERQPHPPTPTHQRFVPGHAPAAELTLLDGELLPWVSMADALGWGMTARPSVTVQSANSSGGGPRPLDGGEGARDRLRTEQAEGRWMVANAQSRATVRAPDEPAPTIKGGKDWMDRHWSEGQPERGYQRQGMVVNTGRDWKEGEDRATAQTRPIDQPSPSIDTRGRWFLDRPATTIQGDSRVFAPGHKRNAEDEAAGREYIGRPDRSIRVTAADAGVLQGFSADYPWQGNRTQQFSQIGNSVPPPLARAVVDALTKGTNGYSRSG